MNNLSTPFPVKVALSLAALGVIVAAVALLAPPGEAMAGDDDASCTSWYDCDCPANHKPSRVEPGFGASCIQSIDATILFPMPGCCSVVGDFGEFLCLHDPCEWTGIKVKVTPKAKCTIRTVVGTTKGAPMTITKPVEFDLPNQSVGCPDDIEDVFELQVRDRFGGWVDIYDLTFHCKICGHNDTPPTD